MSTLTIKKTLLLAVVMVALGLTSMSVVAEGTYSVAGVRHMSAMKKFGSMEQLAVAMEGPVFWSEGSAGKLRIESRIAGALGQFKQRDTAQSFVSIGPVLRFSPVWADRRVSFEFGLSPTILEGSLFSERELGGKFHFTSHLAGNLALGSRRQHVFSLRVQHISNGGLSSTNPGVDMLGMEYRWSPAPTSR